VARETDQTLTDLDAADIARIERALKAMADGSYGQCGQCGECGCDIPFERLKIEPQTEHCVTCKGRWEAAAAKA
jgi:DnaK suppressor protein